MLVNDLPASEFVGIGVSPDEIKTLLTRAVGNSFANLNYFLPIAGAPRSGRLLLQKDHPEAARLPPFNLDEIGKDLVMLNTEARRDPAKPPNGIPGWEIRLTLVDSTPAVIAWAVWTN